VELDLGEFEGWVPEEMLGRSAFPRIGTLPYLLTLTPRGWFWFQLRRDG
jgi:maltose alpha-D-glucosyltransferase/alpha-amylase